MVAAPARTRLAVSALAGCAVFATSSAARAEQVVVVDVAYTHAANTTTDSHYRVTPAAGTPADWTSPVDYAQGSCHVRLEVKTKPTDTPTRFQICFEGTPTYACTDQSPAYTKPGVYEWSTPFTRFYQGNGVSMAWQNGVSRVALILKDTANQKPQGDPLYVPTELRVGVTIVSAGDVYHPPSVPSDSGTDGSEGGGPVEAHEDGGPGSAEDAATATRDAGSGPNDSGDEAPGAVSDASAGEADARAPARAVQSGCALAPHARRSPLALLLAALALGLPRVLRRRGRPR